MAQLVQDLTCPGCGAPAAMSTQECPSCGRPVVITTFSAISDWSPPQVNKYMKAYKEALTGADDPDVHLALGICLLKLGTYDLAMRHIQEAISADVDNADGFLYAAVACLRGRRPFLTPMPDVKTALTYIDAARALESRGIFDYFSAFVRSDFFERKFLRIQPTALDEMRLAHEHGLPDADIDLLHDLIRVPRPA